MNSLKPILKITTAIALSTVPPQVSAAKATGKPDFAYPQTVMTDALTKLKQALDSRNDLQAIRQLLDFTVANNSIGTENIGSSLAEIREVRSAINEPATLAVIDLLQAKIYLGLYQSNKYVYDNRTLPLFPLSGNYLEWSGEQFRSEISKLCDNALSQPEALKNIALQDWSDIITVDRQSLIYTPTLFDFIAHSTIEIRSALSPFSNIGLLSLSPRAIFIFTPGYSPASEEVTKILSTYASLLAFHSSNPAAEIYCDIRRIDFVTAHIYGNLAQTAQSQRTRLLKELYDDYFSKSEYSGDALIALAGSSPYNDNSKQEQSDLYRMCRNSLATYPAFARNNCIDNIISSILTKDIVVRYPMQCVPGKPFDMSVTIDNSTDVKFDIYRIPDRHSWDSWIKQSDLLKLKPVKTINVKTGPQQAPFTIEKIVPVTLDDYGYYVIVPRSDVNTRRNSYPVISCSGLAAGKLNSNTVSDIVVFNPLTGAPVNATDLLLFKNKSVSGIHLGRTDADGLFHITSGTKGLIQPQKGADKSARAINVWEYDRNAAWSTSIAPFSDLAIYHPGDSVKWGGVAYKYLKHDRRLMTGSKFSAILYNASNMPVDTMTCSSDDWGRISGKFKLPDNELTGVYHIRFKENSSDNRSIGNLYFTVSDYKLPTFFIEMDKTATGVPAEGCATISGIAKSYSGVPMGGIPVQAVISASQGRGWFRSQDVSFCSLTDTTDVDGRFSMVLTKESVDNSPAPDGLFTASVTATSSTGESRESSCSFSIGNAYNITSTLPAALDITSKFNMSTYFKVVDSQGKDFGADLDYSIYPEKSTISSLQGAVGSNTSWQKLTPGTYKLKVYPATLKADTLTASVILYDTKSGTSPSEATLWSPVSDETIKENGVRFNLPVFAAQDRTLALLFVSTPDNCIQKKWIKLSEGYNNVEVKLPDGIESATAQLFAAADLKSAILHFTLNNVSLQKSLDIQIETFRDRLTPGQRETWSFRTVGTQGKPEEAAFITGMYNSALDALARQPFSLRFNQGWTEPQSISLAGNGPVSLSYNSSVDMKTCSEIIMPEFMTYGMPIIPAFNRFRMRYMTTSARSGGMLADVEEGNGSVQYKSMKSETYDAAVAVEESSLDLSSSLDEDAGSGNAGDAVNNPEPIPFRYREANVPLAFFEPTLTTDANGNLTYSFTVPDANTTWQFNAAAYTREFTSSVINRTVISNKPVMVTPNMPRFLRAGDKADIMASVINNTDSISTAKVVVELFDPATMETLGNTSHTLELAPNQTKTVSTDINASSDACFIGYRIKATSGNFADGEQCIIPVLPSVTPVIDTDPFYISPDSLSFATVLPEYPANARLTLQYCDNPTWYVVTALPGISANESRTAPDAATAIFSATIADGILRTYPHVRQALQDWTRSDRSDSTLVSMLERNSDLKTFMLQATPWMMDARSDTERMQRLALLFDSDNIRQVYNSNITLLSKLQQSDGGWAWISQYPESSEWATEITLHTLGRLQKLGFMPQNRRLSAMIEKALGYYQKQVSKNYKRTPDADYSSFVMITDCYPSFKPSATAARIIASTVQKRVSSWKKESLEEKANSAIMLKKHGYAPVARKILASMREFASTSPSQGMWWPQLDDAAGGTMTQLSLASRALEAFYLIDPKCGDIDKIRQWLILQKEARDWGNGSSASEVAAAILLTSPTWVNASGPFRIKIGNTPLNVNITDATLGYLRTDISPYLPSGKTLSVTKSEGTPAWGAVYSQSRQSMDQVKASGCDAIDIEKRIYKAVGDRWEAATELRTGDRVKVELLIHANRAADYVAISDDRPACFEPVEQLPAPIYAEGLCFYRENNDDATNIFISRLPKGTYLLTYEMWVNNSGSYSSGIATIQSQYAPQITAHSSGCILSVSPAE